jgi:hypothetical protein
MAAVIAGLAGADDGAVVDAPHDPEHVRLMYDNRYRPPGDDFRSSRMLTFTQEMPGQEFEVFKQNARKNNPFYAMGCVRGAKQHNIGDFIMLCVDPDKINIVIYRDVTLAAIKLLVKKLRHHVKGKRFSRAKLDFFGGQELFTRDEILKKNEFELARTLLSIAKKQTFTRLILENSSGGPLSQGWFHTWRSRRHI